jgi:hypothetical protein
MLTAEARERRKDRTRAGIYILGLLQGFVHLTLSSDFNLRNLFLSISHA